MVSYSRLKVSLSFTLQEVRQISISDRSDAQCFGNLLNSYPGNILLKVPFINIIFCVPRLVHQQLTRFTSIDKPPSRS